MRTFISLLFLLTTYAVTAQKDAALVGKWEISSLNFKGLYYDFKAEHGNAATAFEDSMSGDEDSVMALYMFNALLENMKNVRYIFNTDGTYKCLKGEQIKENGTYIADKVIIHTTHKNKFDKEEKEDIYYELKEGKLFLYPAPEDKTSVVILEKLP